MKIVLQRVENASVKVNNKIAGEIGRGYLILLGVSKNDSEENARKLVEKIHKLRIFPDNDGKSNLSIQDVNGEVLVISQFTLYADCRKGTRPSFTEAGDAENAEYIYNYFVELCRQKFKKTACGIFAADMQVSLINDGPYTILLES